MNGQVLYVEQTIEGMYAMSSTIKEEVRNDLAKTRRKMNSMHGKGCINTNK